MELETLPGQTNPYVFVDFFQENLPLKGTPLGQSLSVWYTLGIIPSTAPVVHSIVDPSWGLVANQACAHLCQSCTLILRLEGGGGHLLVMVYWGCAAGWGPFFQDWTDYNEITSDHFNTVNRMRSHFHRTLRLRLL